MATLIFSSRWLQLPLYLGLIVAQCVYVFLFLKELLHLVLDANALTEQGIMLLVLGLIDVVMISNLLVMVIVGGYETFVSRLGLQGHPDQPEWLSHVNASVLKVKLAMAIIGISSIHLLKTFIAAGELGLPMCGSTDNVAALRATAAAIAGWPGDRSGPLHHFDADRRDVADHHPRRLHPVGDGHRLYRQADDGDFEQARTGRALALLPLRCLPPLKKGAARRAAPSGGFAFRGDRDGPITKIKSKSPVVRCAHACPLFQRGRKQRMRAFREE